MDPSHIDIDFDEFQQEQPQTRRSRSGRIIKNVVRYEPEEDTVFEDDIDYDTELSDDSSEELETANEMSDESDSYTTDEDVSSDEEEEEEEFETEVETETETVVEQEYLEDAIDWETLTDNAQSGDESDEMDSDDDDDE